MKREGIRHPKMYKLAAALSCDLPSALGYMTLFWDFVGSTAPQGDVGKWDDEAIARACEWRAEGALFVRALCASGFLDECSERRFVVHGWKEHCEEFVRKRLIRAELPFFEAVSKASRRRRDNVRTPAAYQTKPILAKPNQSKPQTTADAVLPTEIDSEKFRAAWELWKRHRIEKKKPMNPASEEGLLKKLAKLGESRAIAAIEHSVAQGYQGVYEESDQQHGKTNRDRSGPGQTYSGPPIAVATRNPT